MVTLLIAAWKRPELTYHVLHYYHELRASHHVPAFDIVVCLSKGDPYLLEHEQTCEEVGATVSYSGNSPLSSKLQAGLDHIKTGAVILCGSDDLLTVEYFRSVAAFLEAGIGYIRFAGCLFYDAIQRKLIASKHTYPGAGLCVSRGVLDQLGGILWPEDREHHLDMLMFRQVESVQCSHLKLRWEEGSSLFVLDIKTGENLWHLEESGQHLQNSVSGTRLALRGVRELEAEPFLRHHFPTLADTLLQWSR